MPVKSLPQPSAQWGVYPLLTKAQFQATQAAGLDDIQAQLLYNRGIQTTEDMKTFMAARYSDTRDPLALIDMPRATARLRQGLEGGEHITVYGDYDADGVTSSALLFRALRLLKHADAPLDYHIPHRLRDGCGLNIAALDQLHARGTRLIVTTDCASSDVEQVAYARSLGIDVIITDHHHPPAELPDAYAMVNPWRPDCRYGEHYLCGAGIAFKLVQALYRSFQRSVEDEMDLLDLVAIGTIADIAPLLGENHTLVRLGLQRLNFSQKPGVQALMHSAGFRPGKVRERDIAFALAPRINAAGRMKEASIAFELLTTDSAAEAQARVEELEHLNVSRQQETEELMRSVREQAMKQPDKSVILVSGDNWHEGIIGLVAGKLAEEINKPVLVLSNDNETQLSRGSARSRQGFNIIEALRNFPGSLERYGGHSQAAGFTIRDEQIPALHDHLIQWKAVGAAHIPAIIDGSALPDETGVVVEPESSESASETSDHPPSSDAHMADLVFTRLEMLTYDLYKKLRALGPFGAGNPEPVFKIEHLRLLDSWPSGMNRQNLRLRFASLNGKFRQAGTLIRGARLQPSLVGVEQVNIVFKIGSSEDDARPEIWLKIVDVEPLYHLTPPGGVRADQR
jgi:single-stranded-DNA-specific exonuclease